MRVEQLGDGRPEVAVVGAIHGDEPCGARAIDGLLADRPTVDRPVKTVVVNEAALAQNRRYLDEDLNRAFPGSREAPTHEGRLAHRLLSEIRGLETLSLHSTRSHAEPFAIVDDADASVRGIVPYLDIEALVEATGFTEGRLIDHARVIEIECGIQGSDAAAENAARLARQFLGAVGALPPRGRPPRNGPIPVYQLAERIPKRREGRHEVFVRNFDRVAEGEAFAATDGDRLVADEPFYPVLLSGDGYQDMFGYAADLVGQIEG